MGGLPSGTDVLLIVEVADTTLRYDRDIKIPLRDRTVEFKGLAFLQNWALPNFFFHYVTAYNLLRHNGVDIGKRDFLGS